MPGIGKPGRRGMIAKKIACQLALATALIVDTALTQVNAFGQNVSWSDLNGTYGFYSTGTVVPAGTPRLTVGRETYDGFRSFVQFVYG